jgi:membrane protease YdiL (CAAX protease family)
MVKKFSDRYTTLFSFVVAFVSLALSVAGTLLLAFMFNVDVTNPDIANPEIGVKLYTASVLGKIVMTVFVIFIIITVKMSPVMKPSSKGLLRGLALGWFFILGGVLLCAGSFDFSKISSIKQGAWLVLLIYAAETLLAGISEEFLCRGLLYNTIFSRNKNVKQTVFISSAIFGVIHMINIIHQPIIGTLVQVVYAFAFGVLLTAVYVRCKNIWAVVILHGFFNFATGAANILTPLDNIGVSSVSGIAAEIIAAIPVLVLSIFTVCLGMILIRKKKIAHIF